MTADELNNLTATVARIDERTFSILNDLSEVKDNINKKIEQHDEDIEELQSCAKENKTNIGWIIKIGGGILGSGIVASIILKALNVY
jgi:hypothetical protein